MGLAASYTAAHDDDLGSFYALDADAVGEAVQEAIWDRWATNPSVGIEKTWHGLHFVLTGSADSVTLGDVPLSEAVLGSYEFDAGTGGYATIIRSDRVEALLAALRAVDRELLVETFEPSQLAEQDIYPANIWLRDDPKSLVLELIGSLDTLIEFYEATRALGMGVLVQVF